MEKRKPTSPFAHRKANLLERRAQARLRRRQLIARAPRHPPGIEARMRLLAAQLIAPIRTHLFAQYMQRGLPRTDAPTPYTVARQQLRKSVTPLAKDLAASTHEQVANSLGVSTGELAIDLDEQAYGFVDGMVSILEGYPIEATHRVRQAFEEWESVAEEDRTTESLSTLLDVALDGAEGKLQQSLRLLFGDTFAQMNRAAQVQAGVSGYFWKTQGDARVRPAHRRMENVGDDKPYSWDDPPLSGAESSSGEACHPGEDYNCRCIAIPAEGGPAAAEEDASESE